ncbi:MAG: hypothetical protein JKY50_22585 [Oleispira sp.]|nr:hypothetical protein [Oleispira sp.]
MDNRVFNVNGKGTDMLLQALKLVFSQEGQRTTCSSWAESKEHGLILTWCKGEGDHDLPSDMDASSCLSFVSSWLASDFAKDVVPSEWCGDTDHDGHNSEGWQVYCEGWGHVGGNHYAICAIKPAYMWHGK